MSWSRLAVAGGVIVGTAVVAKFVDARIAKRKLDPSAVTRYRILRRSIVTTIVFVGVVSALLVIPQIRAIAGGILASSAVFGLVIGFAAQRTLGNYIAGLLIAFSQPIRLGDEVEVADARGRVEEIGLTYTWVRLPNNDRLVIPNEKLVSEAIRNSTIRSSQHLAEVSVHVPASPELEELLAELGSGGTEAYLAGIDDGERATILLRRWVPRGQSIERAESDLRLVAHRRLHELGVVGHTSGTQ